MTSKTFAPTLENIFKRMVVAGPSSDSKQRLRQIEKELEKLEDGKNHFFGFEDIEGQVKSATRSLNSEKNRILMAKAGFSELNHSFLAWRKKDTKFPAFVIVSLNSDGNFRITAEDMRDGDFQSEIKPEIPKALQAHFKDTIKYLVGVSEGSYHSNEISITTKLRGVMSDAALRKKVKKVEEDGTFDNIFIIAEADKWEINETNYLDDDPLVVGWVEETEQMFLIGSFDLTPLEEHVKINHTHN